MPGAKQQAVVHAVKSPADDGRSGVHPDCSRASPNGGARTVSTASLKGDELNYSGVRWGTDSPPWSICALVEKQDLKQNLEPRFPL